VIYHVYPRSFADGNGDGVGDLPGITSRLGHLAWLGVDAVWLSPIYPSPGRDAGYDISDHCAVDPLFGSLEDLDRLVARAHGLGLKVLLDFVPNHTSDEHPWFQEARRSRESPKRAWYLWRDEPRPNNWLSVFGGPAWTWDEKTGQAYAHAYLREQPDLDWRNPEVREAMGDVLRFWRARGIDGFRVDALRQVGKDPAGRDNPPSPGWEEGMPEYDRLLPVFSADRDEGLDAARAMRAAMGEDALFVAELYAGIDRLMRYYGAGVDLPSNMHLISTPWTAPDVAALVERYEAALPPGAWPNWVLGNHDRSRIASRVGPAQARVAATLLLTLRGTPTLYYGDELGMADVPVPAHRRVDPVGRDPERAPMPWEPGPHAGFCPPDAEPWLPLAPDADRVNVALQREDPRSPLALHRRLLALRREHPALAHGPYRTERVEGDLLAFRRGEGLLVALGLGPEPAALPAAGRILASTGGEREGEEVRGELRLRGDEGVVLATAG
jgi:alpha-glucosidase